MAGLSGTPKWTFRGVRAGVPADPQLRPAIISIGRGSSSVLYYLVKYALKGSAFLMKKSNKGTFVGEVPLKWFILLHLSLVLNSLAGTASKLAGRQKFLSFKFMFWYGVMLFITMAFAVAWQQILKNMSLTFAFTNKPITIVWGLIWGVTIFRETLTWKMILGSVIILIGIIVGVSDVSGPAEADSEKSGSLKESLEKLPSGEEVES